MKRRDFLTGAFTGVTSAGLLGIADRAAAHELTPKAAPPQANQYKGRVSFAQQGEDLILFNLLRHEFGIERPSYLDIGAGDPVLSNNTYALYGTGSRGVLVEPNPTLVAALASVRPGDVVVNAGVGLTNSREANYYVIRDRWPLNTFSPEVVAELRRRSKTDPVEKILKMPLIHINKLIAEHFKSAPDLVSIDIEGMDLDVLRSMDFTRYRPAAICAETKKPRESHDATPIARLLRARGYVACAGSLYNTIFGDRRRFRT